MKVSDLVKKYNLNVFSGHDGMDKEIAGGYVSDLLSDVMGNAAENEVWITLQTHQNVVAIASLKDLAAVVLVKDLKPDDDTLQHSNEEGIPLLGTSMSTFQMAGRLFNDIMEQVNTHSS